ncbi:MAG TPA: hypothetical protein VL971_04390 [Rhizomicrobium sp.]|nr:hypothetical protein [Rhizomicrobium sp.]
MTEVQPQKPRHSFAFWGCLVPFLVVVGLIATGAIYVTYYMKEGFKTDSSVQTIVATVQQNALARTVLGPNITATGVPAFNVEVKNGKHTGSYTVSLHGNKGDGSVDATVDVVNGKTIINTLKLKGPAGTTYDLIGNGSNEVWLAPASHPLADNTIFRYTTG